ncbi:TPA: phage late control D family protein [Haemophilus influenzae]|uniref:phage late control D family protein n=1 Tax=Haemophilus influenzae TaxID=727 RepID=UPI0001A3F4BF|nr:contractile injection system protein, VgrG/Pvc8 family [Haemophilus influenzae]AKA47537.1 tail protein [Haemophilus influenzae 2019]EEP47432.1 phage late control D family protein [Haemophilus influenzae 6P18H1]KKZ22023.1 tail protein [Haemophilus influenzae 2019]MCK9113034.1 phage late control D family protein [Haemophilus influenzae]PRJ77296.1 Phage late control gene D protein [Haemophilus influenzae]
MFDLNLNDNHRTPAFKVQITTKDKKQQDITQVISSRLISLSLTDNRGLEADTLDLELSDHDGKLALPPRNATIQVALGWKGKPLIDKGQYSVDEVQFSGGAGSADRLTIRARAADLKGSFSEQKERSFDKKTLGEIIDTIAKENQLKSHCEKKLANTFIAHIDQTNESDINLLSRLAEEHGAMCTVKNGTLLFMPLGQGKTASGKPIPLRKITRKSGDSYTFSIAESENYKAVRAYWHDTDTGKRGEIIVDKNTKIVKKQRMTKGRTLADGTVKGRRLTKRKYNTIEQKAPVESDNDKIKNLRVTYPSEARAIISAKSAFDKLKRGVATFSLNLAFGEPDLIPETPIELSGFKAEIDATNWLITKVTHNLSDGGFTSHIECELKVEEDEVEVKKEKK